MIEVGILAFNNVYSSELKKKVKGNLYVLFFNYGKKHLEI